MNELKTRATMIEEVMVEYQKRVNPDFNHQNRERLKLMLQDCLRRRDEMVIEECARVAMECGCGLSSHIHKSDAARIRALKEQLK